MINQHQEQLGVIPTHEALALARAAGLDLVEVSPTENPPVCRIMDYGKHLYERKKKMKMASQGHTVTLKEIRLRPKTDPHDRQIKTNHARDFLQEGHKVQFTMLFKGRERFHREIAQEAFDDILQELGEAAKIERPAGMEGRRMTMILSPGKRTPQAAGSGGQRPPGSGSSPSARPPSSERNSPPKPAQASENAPARAPEEASNPEPKSAEPMS